MQVSRTFKGLSWFFFLVDLFGVFANCKFPRSFAKTSTVIRVTHDHWWNITRILSSCTTIANKLLCTNVLQQIATKLPSGLMRQTRQPKISKAITIGWKVFGIMWWKMLHIVGLAWNRKLKHVSRFLKKREFFIFLKSSVIDELLSVCHLENVDSKWMFWHWLSVTF